MNLNGHRIATAPCLVAVDNDAAAELRSGASLTPADRALQMLTRREAGAVQREQAAHLLLKHYGRRWVLTLSAKFRCPQEDIEELMGEAVMRFIANVQSIQSNPEGYLRRTIQRLRLSEIRRAKAQRRDAGQPALYLSNHDEEGHGDHDLSDHGAHDPCAILEARQLATRLWPRLETAPPRLVRVLDLLAQGQSNEQIAQAIGVAKANVRDHIYRARQLARDLMKELQL